MAASNPWKDVSRWAGLELAIRPRDSAGRGPQVATVGFGGIVERRWAVAARSPFGPWQVSASQRITARATAAAAACCSPRSSASCRSRKAHDRSRTAQDRRGSTRCPGLSCGLRSQQRLIRCLGAGGTSGSLTCRAFATGSSIGPNSSPRSGVPRVAQIRVVLQDRYKAIAVSAGRELSPWPTFS
jgi:hypothetical protein